MTKTRSGAIATLHKSGVEQQGQRTAFDSVISVRLVTAAIAIEECARLLLSDSHFIGLAELRIIAFLFERPRVSVSEISRDLQIDKAWVSRLLRQLEKRQLVERAQHRSDSRQLIVSLTDAGQEFHADVMSRVRPYGDEITNAVDEGALIAMLERLEQNVRTLNARLRTGPTTPRFRSP